MVGDAIGSIAATVIAAPQAAGTPGPVQMDRVAPVLAAVSLEKWPLPSKVMSTVLIPRKVESFKTFVNGFIKIRESLRS